MLVTALSSLFVAASASAVAIAPRAAITDFNDTSPIAWAYPPGRGFSVASADDAPCGGLPVGDRTPYPMSGGDVAFTQITNMTDVYVMYTNESDPQRFHSFSFYSNGLEALGAGHYCSKAPDFSTLGFTAGANATLLVIYKLEESSQQYYYQCADVSLVETATYTAPDDYVCGNYTGTLEESSGDSLTGGHSSGSGTGAAMPSSTGTSADAANSDASVSSSENDGLSAAAGGGIGAAVTLVVVAIGLALAAFAGYLQFGKKRQGARGPTGDDASSSSGVPTMKQAGRA